MLHLTFYFTRFETLWNTLEIWNSLKHKFRNTSYLKILDFHITWKKNSSKDFHVQTAIEILEKDHHWPCSGVFIANLKIFHIFSTAFIVGFELVNIFWTWA